MQNFHIHFYLCNNYFIPEINEKTEKRSEEMEEFCELSSSLEDYLEAIVDIENRASVVRVKDVAEQLNVKRSSVTAALQTLAEKGLVDYSPYAVIALTHSGRTIANCICNRHRVLKELFIKLFDAEVAIAEKSACEMEHGMKSSVYRGMLGLLNLIEKDEELFMKVKNGIAQNTPENLCNDEGCGACCGESGGKKPLLTDLNALKEGDSGIIKKVLGDGAVKKRYIEMGVTIGQAVKVLKVAPLGDPIEVEIRKYRLSLRRSEAENILIEKVEKQ